MKKKLNAGTPVQIVLPNEIQPTYELPDPILLGVYQDRTNRIIKMYGEIDDEVYNWIDFILRCNREDRDLPIEKRKPIKCIIANYGGALEQAKTLIEIISLSKTPVYGIAIGMCASAASMIFLSCHKRFALNSSTFLFHKGSCQNIGGNYSQLMQFIENYKYEVEELTTFYKTHTKYPQDVIEQNILTDWYIHVDQALQNGVIDEIVDDIEDLL